MFFLFISTGTSYIIRLFIRGKIFHCVFLVCAMFVSCKSVRESRPVYITDENTITLLPPSAAGASFETSQLLTGSFSGHEGFSGQAFLVVDERRLDLMMMTTTGQTICTILWDGENLCFSSPFIQASKIKAEYIVADMQMAFYDHNEVGKLISSSGLLFRFSSGGNTEERMVYRESELVWSMVKDGNMISVVNHLRNYRYDIEILSWESE